MPLRSLSSQGPVRGLSESSQRLLGSKPLRSISEASGRPRASLGVHSDALGFRRIPRDPSGFRRDSEDPVEHPRASDSVRCPRNFSGFRKDSPRTPPIP
eukprot:4047773-Pyramimonas_sp.AAC.1